MLNWCIEELTSLLATSEDEDRYIFKDKRALNRFDVCKRMLSHDVKSKNYDHDSKLTKKEKKPGKFLCHLVRAKSKSTSCMCL